MKISNYKFTKLVFAAFLTLFLSSASTKNSFACATGCAILDISTSSLLPSRVGGLAFVEYDYINQDQNWSGTRSASKDLNHHKRIKTQIATAGLQYNFNRDFGLTLRVPYVSREVKVEDHSTGHILQHSNHSIGDIRLTGTYSGFVNDMSSGIILGAKLPTGDYKYSEFHHRDFQIGSGSTDVIVGGYKIGKLSDDGVVGYFAQGTLQKPVATSQNYRPGGEVNIALGANYNFGQVGEFSKVLPLIQLITSKKMQDRGINSDGSNTGYSQILLSPGIELDTKEFKFYADMKLPVYNNVRGNQLAVTEMFKFIVGYKF
ncbi:MAG: hypothetical protein K0R25_264 [Rickettsiaceae bacterium]|jgi:hypothetical protein|nr:hypothetical protein [Rickettsiaceae bacterium]